MSGAVDTTNKHLVSTIDGGDVVIINPPPRLARMSRVDALTFAAWIVVVADTGDDPTFAEIREAIEGT
jgi:hypothetical protein